MWILHFIVSFLMFGLIPVFLADVEGLARSTVREVPSCGGVFEKRGVSAAPAFANNRLTG